MHEDYVPHFFSVFRREFLKNLNPYRLLIIGINVNYATIPAIKQSHIFIK